jgi:membrane fusion protein (multidrug efflux system)
VIDGGIAHGRLITTGRRQANAVEVLSGLSEGERVASPVPPDLADGARVEVKQSARDDISVQRGAFLMPRSLPS